MNEELPSQWIVMLPTAGRRKIPKDVPWPSSIKPRIHDLETRHRHPELAILIKPLFLLLLHKIVKFYQPCILQRNVHTENNFKYHRSSVLSISRWGKKPIQQKVVFFSFLFFCLKYNGFSIPALTKLTCNKELDC